jgi:RimJ/RimL family protein N-acetyltransferase
LTTVLRTARLTLDELEPERDALFVLELLNEPSFVENIRDSGVRTPEDARRYVQDGPRASYAAHGYGLWRVALTATGEPVGLCGLVRRETLPGPDLGFAYLERHQRQGYGREAAVGVLRYAQETLRLPQLLAIAAPHNTASASLLQSLGFQDDGEAPGPAPARLFSRQL